MGIQIDHESKIFWDYKEIENAREKFNISDNTKNIVCGISASGPYKKIWDHKLYKII